MKLFEDKIRSDNEPSTHNDDLYDYYDRSDRAEMTAVREMLNEWFSHYPDSRKHHLKREFQTKFSAAYFELFLFHLFKNQGFEIIIHPTLPDSPNKPDFLLKKGNFECYVEAKEAKDKSEAEEALENRINSVYDIIDKIYSPDFAFWLDELQVKTVKQPSLKPLKNHILKELKKYDPDEVDRLVSVKGLDARPKIEFCNDELFFVMYLAPKLTQYRNMPSRNIICFPGEAVMGGAEESIKSSIQKKAGRYGKLDKPFFICINAVGIMGNGNYDADKTFWGSIAASFYHDSSGKRVDKWIRANDGIFLDNKGARYENVNGILIMKAFEYNIHRTPYWFAKHPFAASEVDFSAFDLEHYFIESDQIIKKGGKTTGEILNIEENWLTL